MSAIEDYEDKLFIKLCEEAANLDERKYLKKLKKEEKYNSIGFGKDRKKAIKDAIKKR